MKQDDTPSEVTCSQSPITISLPHSVSQGLESKDDQFISSSLTSACASQISADDNDHQLLDESMLTQTSSGIVFSQSSNTTDQCCSQIVSDISSQGTIRDLDHIDADIKTFYDQLASQISQEFSPEINAEYSTDSSSSIDFDALLSNSVSAVSHDTDSSHYNIKYEKETEDVNGEVGHITLLHQPGITLNSEPSILQFELPVVNPVLASVLSHAPSDLINESMFTIATQPVIAAVEAPNISGGPPTQLLFVSDGSDDESEGNELNIAVGDEGACCIPSEGSLL